MTQTIMMIIEPDILECEVKWALGSITTYKANRSDEIPVSFLYRRLLIIGPISIIDRDLYRLSTYFSLYEFGLFMFKEIGSFYTRYQFAGIELLVVFFMILSMFI